MNSETFEQQLKQLRPTNCDDRLADTFYKSGWDACQKSLERRSIKPIRSSRSVPTFVTGLACGLMVSICSLFWAFQGDQKDQVMVVDKPREPSAEIALPDSSQKILSRPQSEVTSMVPDRSIWKIDDLFVVSPLSVEKSSPLSLAAKNSWMAQMQSVNHPLVTAKTNTGPEQDTLTSSPLNQQRLNELLL